MASRYSGPVPEQATPDNDPLRATRVFLRPIASPFALGFVGLAGDTVTVAGQELGFAALYGAASLEIEGMRHSPLLPTLRRGEGRQALKPQLLDQVSDVAAEAGVRKQL